VEITDVEKSDHVKITGKGKGIVTWEFADGGVRISDIPAGVTQVDLYYDYSEYDWDRDGATDDVDPDDDDDGIPDDVEEALGSDPFDPEDLPGGLGADPTVETHTVNGHDVFVAYEGTGEIKVKQAGRTPDLPDHLAPTGIYLDITVSGGSLDRMVLSIDLGDVQVGPDENIGIYHYDEDRGEWVDIPGARYLRDTNKVVVVVDHLTLFAVVKVLGEERDVDTGDGDDGDGDTGEKENSSKGMDQFCAVAGLLMIIGLALFFWFSKRVNGKEEAKARDGKAGRGPPAARSGKDREDER